MKQCTVCNETKELDQFKKHSETKDGLHSYCKKCGAAKQRAYRHRVGNIHSRAYEKTEKGYLMRSYRNMKSRVLGIVKKKAHLYVGKEIVSKDQFYQWALNNDTFKALFEAYKQSGYNIKYAPSVDRVDSTIGYRLDNMRWLTHSQNSLLGTLSRHNKAA